MQTERESLLAGRQIGSGMSDSWKVFLSIAIGALIGCLVAENINHWFWWVGMIVGGLTGYLLCDWHRVVVAAGSAWRAACVDLPKKVLSWRPHPNAKLALVAITSGFFVGWCWLMLVINGAIVGLDAFMCHVSGTLTTANELIAFLLFISGIITAVVAPSLLAVCVGVYFESKFGKREHIVEMIEIAWICFPPVLILLALISLPGWIKSAATVSARFIKTFTVRLFLEIHSQKRLICGAYTALTVLTVHLAGGSLLIMAIGALAGGLIGLVNFKFITLRWLVPKGYVTLKD